MSDMIRKLINRLSAASLGAQLVGLLLVAVIAAQTISIWVFHDERRLAIIEVARDSILQRSVSMVQLLEETPETYHARILQASSSHFSKFWVSPEPAVATPPGSKGEEKMSRYLGAQFEPPREARVDIQKVWRPKIRDDDGERRRRWDDDDDDEQLRPWEREKLKRPSRGKLELTMSIRLADGKWLNLATDYRPPPRSLIPLMTQMGMTIIAIVVIVGLAVRRLAKPLRNLAAAADRLGRGEDLPPLSVEGPREVRAVTTAFNDMQARLTRFVNDRTRMLAAISHDLRTPITSLRLRAEFIDDDENRNKIIETLDEMAQMTEATLAFARDEATREAAVPTDLTSLVESIAADQQDLGHTVSVTDGDRIVLTCRSMSLKRALRNLIENGIRYGEAVDVRLRQDGGEAQILISDRGPGIPEDRLSDVFEPFVRLEESRSEETGGIGLGLAITRSIIHAHGGTIELKNGADEGLTVEVRLPLGR
ncbi:ATP-binding protein [Roseibium sp.]|uniref:ATP-binding protein n=1 Tax=Roseibium sp. TaxID=1936156 RepID=UPI003A97C530